MKKTVIVLTLALMVGGASACEQSYTEKAKSGETGQRDEDLDETGKSVNDQADGGMGDNEGQTETNRQ